MAETTHAPKTNDKPKHEPAKLAEDFVPNEMADHLKSGRNEKGEADGTLGESQVSRAATEALLSLRPQPSADELQRVLDALDEADPKTGQPKKKFKTAKEAGDAAVAELNKQRGG